MHEGMHKGMSNDVVGLCSRTSPCPSVDPSANWASIASFISSYGCSTRGCNGRACPYHKTPTASRPSTIRPSTKSLPNGRMTGRSGRRSSPVCGISRPRSNSISPCSMATGPTPWPKKGRWDWLLWPQTSEGRQGHCHHRQSWLCVSACPSGSRQ